MLKIFFTFFLILLSFSITANQVISCTGQSGKSIIDINLSPQASNFTYSWDGANEDDIKTLDILKIYEKSKNIGYKTLGGQYLFRVQMPRFIISKKISNFYIKVWSDIGDFDENGEIFDDCSSEISP